MSARLQVLESEPEASLARRRLVSNCRGHLFPRTQFVLPDSCPRIAVTFQTFQSPYSAFYGIRLHYRHARNVPACKMMSVCGPQDAKKPDFFHVPFFFYVSIEVLNRMDYLLSYPGRPFLRRA